MRVALLALALAPAVARGQAQGFAESYLGATLPLGEKKYDDLVEASFKLGVRGGVWLGNMPRVGFEGSFDFSPLSAQATSFVLNYDAKRIRFLGGIRLGFPFGRVLVYLRVAAGIDYVSYTGLFLGRRISDSNTGVAFDPGVGVMVAVVGPLRLGAQLSFPIGIHHDAQNTVLDYTSTDLDMMFVIGAVF
ncbi:MAG TPA: outer membrane beta-barrel protein [Haliangiales bacterium]|nr:outer membrane beta-barrel protein [Haliangiales bacterium]